jgi:amino acid transporter
MPDDTTKLRRRLNLTLLTLYGIGVTIGAGIYVLIGAVAGHAGTYAPLSFVLAAIVMGLTVGSYAELCTRYPVAAGEAAYIKAAFRLQSFSTVVGLLMVATGVIAASTVALGALGYISQFVDLPAWIVLAVIVGGLGVISAWGVLESVLLASLFTVIEVSGLAAIIIAAVYTDVPFVTALTAWPSANSVTWFGIAFASLLAFFAFTGFEDLTNMVEETHAPERNVPIAMAITLVVTTLLYAIIAAIAVTAIPPRELAGSAAPLSLVFQRVAGITPVAISAIAIVSTLNTVIAQMTMAVRVLYGLAQQGDIPAVFGKVNRKTSTPLVATATIIAAVLVCDFLAPLEKLAELTSLGTLAVFALVNLALLRLRATRATPRGAITVPIVVPVLGFFSCIAMMITALI